MTFGFDTFRAGGKGGQKQNKTESGVRIVHVASGISAEARDGRDQLHNKKKAFERLCEKPEFKKWLKVETAKQLGQFAEIEDSVNGTMAPHNLKIEYYDPNR